jgi:hypothetical protein
MTPVEPKHMPAPDVRQHNPVPLTSCVKAFLRVPRFAYSVVDTGENLNLVLNLEHGAPLSSPLARRFPANSLHQRRIKSADSFPVYPSRFVILVLRTGVLTIGLAVRRSRSAGACIRSFQNRKPRRLGISSGISGIPAGTFRDFPGPQSRSRDHLTATDSAAWK